MPTRAIPDSLLWLLCLNLYGTMNLVTRDRRGPCTRLAGVCLLAGTFLWRRPSLLYIIYITLHSTSQQVSIYSRSVKPSQAPSHVLYTPANTPSQMPVQHRKENRMTGYNALWDKQAAKDTVDHVKSRVDNYTELVNGG